MTADQFARAVRNGAEKLRVDDIVVNIGEREIRGKGMLRIGREAIALEMTLDSGEKPPARRCGVFTRSDYWKLSGVIEDILQFKCDYVGGGNESFFLGSGARRHSRLISIQLTLSTGKGVQTYPNPIGKI